MLLKLSLANKISSSLLKPCRPSPQSTLSHKPPKRTDLFQAFYQSPSAPKSAMPILCVCAFSFCSYDFSKGSWGATSSRNVPPKLFWSRIRLAGLANDSFPSYNALIMWHKSIMDENPRNGAHWAFHVSKPTVVEHKRWEANGGEQVKGNILFNFCNYCCYFLLFLNRHSFITILIYF